MKNRILLIAILVLLPALCWGQGKFYTRKMRLEGYFNKTTKVVLPGKVVLDSELQTAVTSQWRATPYEFCTEEEYENLKGRSQYFFLRVVEKSRNQDTPGIYYLSMSKGGPDNQYELESAFDVIDFPFAASGQAMFSPLELAILPALLDIAQQYLADASQSVKVADAALKSYGSKPELRKYGVTKVVTDEEEAVSMLANFAPQAAVALIVGPKDADPSAVYYHMVIGTDNHKLYSVAARKGESEFTSAELKMFSNL